ncbi:hypothetical protein BN174_3010003 [Clostridioides difficile E15]|nr:hypothetical protein BN169_900116 [Clostridioides difficile E16]CCL31974.1 hypothetical protein BN174_3010003 [Clostridioides difficile E15]CCL39720.1 hypothetical protein BN176_2940003 [Clostridioides difficile E19]CCL54900.1 hypothetical protein BN180_2490001 [Clostridioides difficile E14]CCL70537.1 hypothetical protein BN184_2590001 [Clostridioides difficile T3]CCL78142.1 hypothetical protein BN186_2290002 [Clostridioides difficile E23]
MKLKYTILNCSISISKLISKNKKYTIQTEWYTYSIHFYRIFTFLDLYYSQLILL